MGQLLFIKRKESTTAVSPLGLKKCCLVKESTLGRACFNPSSAFLHLQSSQSGAFSLSQCCAPWITRTLPLPTKGLGGSTQIPKVLPLTWPMAHQGVKSWVHGTALEPVALQSLSTDKIIAHISSFLKETCPTSFPGAETGRTPGSARTGVRKTF